MRQPTCYIIGASVMSETFSPEPDDLVIAADGGLLHLQNLHITPDIIIGDFDSLGRVPQQPEAIRYPVEKDDTDMMLAIKSGLEAGFSQFILYGGLGGRFDHSLANIQCLAYLANRNARGFLAGDGTVLTVIRDGALHFNAGMSGTISVISFGSTAEGVTLQGLKYPLKDAVLKNDSTLGISNEFTRSAASVSVRKGSLIVIWFAETFEIGSVQSR